MRESVKTLSIHVLYYALVQGIKTYTNLRSLLRGALLFAKHNAKFSKARILLGKHTTLRMVTILFTLEERKSN